MPSERDHSRSEPSLNETIDNAVRRVVTAVAIAGAAIALALYSRPGPPRFQAFATDDGIVRVDTRSGTVLACEGTRCYTVVRRGQRLEKGPAARNEAAPAAPAREALPAPAPAPKALPAPAPAG